MIVADNTIGTSSTFTYELDISTRIPSTGKLSISFHPDFNLTPNEVISCTATYGFTGSAACAVDATGTFIELQGAFPTTDFLLIFDLQGIVNPSYESTFVNFI